MCCRLAVNETAAAAASLPLRRDSFSPLLFPPAISTSPVLSVLFVSSCSFFYLRESFRTRVQGLRRRRGEWGGGLAVKASRPIRIFSLTSQQERDATNTLTSQRNRSERVLWQTVSIQTHFTGIYLFVLFLYCKLNLPSLSYYYQTITALVFPLIT